jgi:predicted Rossmann fold flavoprotein
LSVSAAPSRYDAIVLGAGGAGLMCAAVAGQRGRRVLVVDHADAPGKKILISGGGRCNFTNVDTAPDRYLSANPHFAKSALGRYSARDFIDLVDRYGIAWHEKTLGQLFCDGSARQIVEMLLDECDGGGVTLALGAAIRDVDHADGLFRVTHGAQVSTAPALVIATGGPSIPKIGATGFAYDLARRFGLKVVEPRPALVPLTLPGRRGAVPIAVGRVRAGRRPLRQGRLPRGRAIHPSRPVRPGDPSGLLLLAAWRADRHRLRCPRRSPAG